MLLRVSWCVLACLQCRGEQEEVVDVEAVVHLCREVSMPSCLDAILR